jgi:hypothetical protein
MLQIMRRSTGVRDSPRDLSGNGGAGFLSRTRPPCHPDRTAWDLGLGNPGQTLLSIRRGTEVAANTELNWQQNRTRSVASFRPTQIENASKLATVPAILTPNSQRIRENSQHFKPGLSNRMEKGCRRTSITNHRGFVKKAVPLIAAMILSVVWIARAEEGCGCLNPHFRMCFTSRRPRDIIQLRKQTLWSMLK